MSQQMRKRKVSRSGSRGRIPVALMSFEFPEPERMWRREAVSRCSNNSRVTVISEKRQKRSVGHTHRRRSDYASPEVPTPQPPVAAESASDDRVHCATDIPGRDISHDDAPDVLDGQDDSCIDLPGVDDQPIEIAAEAAVEKKIAEFAVPPRECPSRTSVGVEPESFEPASESPEPISRLPTRIGDRSSIVDKIFAPVAGRRLFYKRSQIGMTQRTLGRSSQVVKSQAEKAFDWDEDAGAPVTSAPMPCPNWGAGTPKKSKPKVPSAALPLPKAKADARQSERLPMREIVDVGNAPDLPHLPPMPEIVVEAPIKERTPVLKKQATEAKLKRVVDQRGESVVRAVSSVREGDNHVLLGSSGTREVSRNVVVPPGQRTTNRAALLDLMTNIQATASSLKRGAHGSLLEHYANAEAVAAGLARVLVDNSQSTLRAASCLISSSKTREAVTWEAARRNFREVESMDEQIRGELPKLQLGINRLLAQSNERAIRMDRLRSDLEGYRP
ncbi:hypothetical protein BV898_09973 [Hypsibius exemplaris]|uniref:Uncharacterized protein n=1 Tax=Hypsibius exemplaris TaxID=2072580 RepID=A0A1W0WL38_HYPEX|nr:hypothetical protein BV898_09973 [Hypsibius exemplaris]